MTKFSIKQLWCGALEKVEQSDKKPKKAAHCVKARRYFR